jgi:class 3 adenylate cyclase
VNDRLDYFGATARVAAALPEHAEGGVLLTEPVFADPVVADLLGRGEFSPAKGQLQSIDLPGRPQQLVQTFLHSS